MGCGIGRFGKYEKPRTPRWTFTNGTPGLKDVKWNDILNFPDKAIGLLPNLQACKSSEATKTAQ